VDRASHAVSAIIAAGVLPAALEMMDNAIIRAVEKSVFTAGLPVDAQAVLLVELDGVEAGIDDDADRVEAILREHGARSVRSATDQDERKRLWAARKGAFGAVGRLSPDIMIQDAVVPRSRLPEVLAETYRIAKQYNLQLANVFHAGDGNLHPLICFDLRRGDDLERVRQAGREIMETCVRAGGSITGEHGVGLDKSAYLPLIFSEDDMDAMLRVRAAFDPSGLCNPGKIIPMPRGCGEARAVATQSLLGARASRPHERGAASLESVDEQPPERQSLSAHRSGGAATARIDRPASSRAKTATSARLAERISEARIANEFKRIVGALNVNRLSETDLAAKFQTNTSETERALSIAPATAGEAREVMELAAREDLAVIPAGSSSWLDVGNPLSRADLILTTRRMTKIIRHEPADLVATAEAGTTLLEFQKQLASAGQWLPVDPPDDGRATLGGVVASGQGGAQSFGYGLPRAFVIGMRVVLADGRSIKAGGNVVKNVAGYDLCKLFTGSYGTLGLITELTFKLRPLPLETRTIIATGSLSSLLAPGRAVISGSLFPVAVELLSPRLAHCLKVGGRQSDYALLVRFVGSSRSVVSQTAQALKLVRSDRNTQARTLDEDEPLWSNLATLTSGVAGNLSWRVSLRAVDLLSFVNEAAALEKDEASHLWLMWHAGMGDGRLRAIAQPAVYHREAVRALVRLRENAETLGGHLVVENAPLEIKNEFDAWGGFGSARELMKRVKQQLDPQDLLSPGRFEGVI
jgi:FAD/FMN-containing dehydrogenase